MSKNSTTIFIQELLYDKNGKFGVDIRCPFVPKTVTISNVSYANDDSVEPGFSDLSSNIISTLDNILVVFRDENAAASNSGPKTFRCSGPVYGTIDFYYNTDIPREGILTFALTFED